MKKEERIVKILNMVDETYIEEATPVPQKKIRYSWKMWTGMVAAIICAAGVSLYSFNHFGERDIITPEIDPIDTTEQSVSTENTEQIETTESTEVEGPQYHEDGRMLLTAGINADGMGFEGLMFYDISENSSLNPWTKDSEIERLPVFKNLSYTQGPGYAIWLDNDQMLEKAETVADGLGTEIVSTEYRSIPAYDEWTAADRSKAYEMVATTDLGEIKVIGNGDINIFLEPAIELPSQYCFTWSDTSDEDAKRVMEYLLEQYQELIDLEQPVAESWGHYSFSGSQHREYYVFEGKGSLEEQIIHYNFAKVEFSPNDGGNLWNIRCGNLLDSAEKMDDYPIISWQTAQELLLRGDYITTVPKSYLENGLVKEEQIAEVELVYRTGRYDQVYMPYYRFYVELKEANWQNMAEGLKNFGAFYVPAVSGEYLTNFPVWEGQFN